MNTCYSCDFLEGRAHKPWDPIYKGTYWIVDHAVNCSLVGWLVIVTKRHVHALHELTHEEYTELTQLMERATKLMRKELTTDKEYAACFAEAPGYEHIHFHIVPRRADMGEETKGVKVFTHLKPPTEADVPIEQIQKLVETLRTEFIQNQP